MFIEYPLTHNIVYGIYLNVPDMLTLLNDLSSLAKSWSSSLDSLSIIAPLQCIICYYKIRLMTLFTYQNKINGYLDARYRCCCCGIFHLKLCI